MLLLYVFTGLFIVIFYSVLFLLLKFAGRRMTAAASCTVFTVTLDCIISPGVRFNLLLF